MARRCSAICLPLDQARYPELVADPAADLPQEKWTRSYRWVWLCARSNSAGDTYPSDECRRTRL